MTLLNVFRGSADLAGGIVEQRLLLLRIHLPEQIARLLPVIVIHPVIPVGGSAADLERRLIKLRLVGPLATAVGEVGRSCSEIAVGAHCTVAMIAMNRTLRRVDRD